MDQEEFKRKLSEVAQWRIPETITGTKDGNQKKPRRRGRPSEEDLYQEAHEEIFLEIHNGINPTFPLQITELKTCEQACVACGQICKGGQSKEAKFFNKPKNHWREKCVTCGLYKNPYTGRYELTSFQSSQAWFAWTRGLNSNVYINFNPEKTSEDK